MSVLCLQGRHLTRGSRLVDFTITLGDSECVPVSLTDNQVDCRPPALRPHRLSNSLCPDNDALSLKVCLYVHISLLDA